MSELGRFKEVISESLFKDVELRSFLLNIDENAPASQSVAKFKKHVFSHLFIDDTIQDQDTFIYYDTAIPYVRSQTKTCKVVMYIICHKDILEDFERDGYYGNRTDILSEMVENVLLNDKDIVNKFGIGELKLDSVDIYNSQRFYGRILTFIVPDFR